MVNAVMLVGRAGRDPEMRYFESGRVKTTFSLAVNRPTKEKETDWFDIEIWGRQAEIAGEYLHKGSRVYLEGRKRTESWDDNQSGGKRYRDFVYADRIEFLDSKGSGNGHRQPSESAYDETTVTDQEAPF